MQRFSSWAAQWSNVPLAMPIGGLLVVLTYVASASDQLKKTKITHEITKTIVIIYLYWFRLPAAVTFHLLISNLPLWFTVTEWMNASYSYDSDCYPQVDRPYRRRRDTSTDRTDAVVWEAESSAKTTDVVVHFSCSTNHCNSFYCSNCYRIIVVWAGKTCRRRETKLSLVIGNSRTRSYRPQM